MFLSAAWPWPSLAGPAGNGHWAFQPVVPPEVPAVRRVGWVRTPIDAFVLQRLEAEELEPGEEADPGTWLRRVTLDLTGLPPTPEAVRSFLSDRRADARHRVVEALLASPRYGERWAQHWLDVVRYADTHGFEVNTERPNAWPYRDYVVRAFNADTPYDVFVHEQIAGDQVGADAATGFLLTASVLLPGQIGADEPSKRLARQDALDEIVVNAAQTFLGLSVGCARCHDHKSDPVLQREYYAFQACFAGVEYEDRDLRTAEADALRLEAERCLTRIAAIDRRLAWLGPLAGSGASRPAVNARLNGDRFAPVTARRLRFTIRATNRLEPCLDEVEVLDREGTNVALAAAGTVATASGETFSAGRHELRFVNDGRRGNESSWMSERVGGGWVMLTFPREVRIETVLWGRDGEGVHTDRLATDYLIEVAGEDGVWRHVADASDRGGAGKGSGAATEVSGAGWTEPEAAEVRRLGIERRELEANLARVGPGQKVFAGLFRKPDVIRRLPRGDPEQPREEVNPDVPSILGSLGLDTTAGDAERRARLAEWLTRPTNPLVARVMVNRVWQGHFGTGLVETPNDFGLQGARPSHPALLDWLATEFVRSGWSVKHLHRLVVLSATYAQASRIRPAAQARDADSRWLWRFPSRRLEAEAIRDTMLAVSGRLNLAMYGRGFDLFDLRGGLSGFRPVESHPPAGRRRMVYAHKVRREREAVFGAFDCPDAGQSTARRRESTTPLQALNLFNSRFTQEESLALAERVRSETGNAEPAVQVRHLFLLGLGREARAEEVAEAVPIARAHGLSVLCRALFNSNEFLELP